MILVMNVGVGKVSSDCFGLITELPLGDHLLYRRLVVIVICRIVAPLYLYLLCIHGYIQ